MRRTSGAGPAAAPDIASALALQRTAGNSAVGRLLEVGRGADWGFSQQPIGKRAPRRIGTAAVEPLAEESAGRSEPLPESVARPIGRLAGQSLADVTVHYASPAPATAQALAYTSGNDIYLGPRQEEHLSHEAWHVVQQRRGQARVCARDNGLPVDDSPALEAEADAMARRATRAKPAREPDVVRPTAGIVSAPIVQRVKARIGALAGNTNIVGVYRALIQAMRAQIAEYNGYPPAVAQADGKTLAQVTTEINDFEAILDQLVNDLHLTPGDAIRAAAVTLQYGNTAHLTTFLNRINTAKRSLNDRFDTWQIWHASNPDSVDDLTEVRTADDLGYDGHPGVRFGTFNYLVYRLIPGFVPSRADGEADTRYQNRLEQDQQITTLRTDVEQMDMSAAAAPIRGNLVDSPSVGAGAMRERLGQSGEMTLTRVMSAGEAQATRDAHGALIPKGAAAKWLTIGGSANINSSGDTAHSQTVQWKLDANFRKVLLKPGMNYYNENLDVARDYVEPYWVWKDAEGANIAFSPVVVPIFNDMIVSVRVNGQLIDRH